MTLRSKLWRVAAVLFTLLNLAGAGFAAARAEPLHTGIHVGLLLLGAVFVWWLAPGRDARRVWHGGNPELPVPPGELTDRLTHLEQSVDAVAIEVERIGEGQRFMTRLFTEAGSIETGAPRAPGEGAAEPIQTKAPGAAPHAPR